MTIRKLTATIISATVFSFSLTAAATVFRRATCSQVLDGQSKVISAIGLAADVYAVSFDSLFESFEVSLHNQNIKFNDVAAVHLESISKDVPRRFVFKVDLTNGFTASAKAWAPTLSEFNQVLDRAGEEAKIAWGVGKTEIKLKLQGAIAENNFSRTRIVSIQQRGVLSTKPNELTFEFEFLNQQRRVVAVLVPGVLDAHSNRQLTKHIN